MAQCAVPFAKLLTIARTSSKLCTDILCHKLAAKSDAGYFNEERHNSLVGLSCKPALLNRGFAKRS